MEKNREKQLNIVMIGAGNVAHNLTRRLVDAGQQIVQIIGHSEKNARNLSTIANCNFSLRVEDIDSNAHLYIIAIPDGAIVDVVKSMPELNGIVVHTSGSTSMGIFQSRFPNHGVFYPFQTFSKDRDISLKDVPICIEASDDDTFNLLLNLAELLGSRPLEMDFETRKWLHLSGVFSCNFVNHMLAIGQLIAQENDFDFGLLKPLVTETIQKAMELGPVSCQTGPAIRSDSETIKKHVAMLSSVSDDLRELYMSLSSSIWQLEHGD